MQLVLGVNSRKIWEIFGKPRFFSKSPENLERLKNIKNILPENSVVFEKLKTIKIFFEKLKIMIQYGTLKIIDSPVLTQRYYHSSIRRMIGNSYFAILLWMFILKITLPIIY